MEVQDFLFSPDKYDGEMLDDEYIIGRALYDYKPLIGDVCAIPLSVGDVVFIFKKEDLGWFSGECNGNYGLFPGSYVAEIQHVIIKTIPSNSSTDRDTVWLPPNNSSLESQSSNENVVISNPLSESENTPLIMDGSEDWSVLPIVFSFNPQLVFNPFGSTRNVNSKTKSATAITPQRPTTTLLLDNNSPNSRKTSKSNVTTVPNTNIINNANNSTTSNNTLTKKENISRQSSWLGFGVNKVAPPSTFLSKSSMDLSSAIPINKLEHLQSNSIYSTMPRSNNKIPVVDHNSIIINGSTINEREDGVVDYNTPSYKPVDPFTMDHNTLCQAFLELQKKIKDLEAELKREKEKNIALEESQHKTEEVSGWEQKKKKLSFSKPPKQTNKKSNKTVDKTSNSSTLDNSVTPSTSITSFIANILTSPRTEQNLDNAATPIVEQQSEQPPQIPETHQPQQTQPIQVQTPQTLVQRIQSQRPIQNLPSQNFPSRSPLPPTIPKARITHSISHASLPPVPPRKDMHITSVSSSNLNDMSNNNVNDTHSQKMIGLHTRSVSNPSFETINLTKSEDSALPLRLGLKSVGRDLTK